MLEFAFLAQLCAALGNNDGFQFLQCPSEMGMSDDVANLVGSSWTATRLSQ